MGTVTQLLASTPQAAPDEAALTACFTKTMFEAAIAEGYRRACEEFGIPYFPQASPARVLSLVAPGPAS